MNSAPIDPLIGQTLDERYVVRSRIARGGMAMVYLGDDLRLGRNVAIKIMHSHLADDENFTKRFEQEARSAAGLGHPHIVNVFDQGVANGVPYLVMEYLPGITLRQLLKQQRQLTPDQAFEISEALLSGLAAAHDADIVHRDVKPENVLLADDGRIKIGDFGLARAVSANTTTGQALLGTIAYLSPELVTRGVADARSDLYAFGIVLFEMLTGKQPYAGEQPMQIAYQHAHSDVPVPSTVMPETPQEFDELVRWTTHRDPDSRPSNAREALEYLRSFRPGSATMNVTRALPATTALDSVTPSTTVLSSAQQVELAASAPVPPAAGTGATAGPAVARAQAASRRRQKRGRWIAVIFIVLLAIAGGVGWWWGQGPGSKVTVPEISGLQPIEAQTQLEELSLLVEPFECSSLTVAPGLAAATEPAEGTRVDRGSTVRMCTSTGPAQLQLPDVSGLSLEEATEAIEEARFTFGIVREERFSDAMVGTVIALTDPEGNEISGTYPEQATIDIVLSAGGLPDLAGNSVDQATNILTTLGLILDGNLNESVHDEEIAEGKVIALITTGDVVRKGDSVGLRLSLGKPLVEVPDVEGLGLRAAMEALRSAGLEPQTALPEILWDVAEVDRATEPKAGESVPVGTEVRVRASV